MTRLTLILLLLFMSTGSHAEGDFSAGQLLYQDNCAQCHGDNGAGAGISVDFSRGDGLLISDYDLTERLKKGNGICPAFAWALEESQFSELIYFMRVQF